ncbi:MAG TPA: cation diffusion facilitator family transporter [Candidatus Bathyarchaeia archaeon]|nr:cation diffusion facilitator family transporter [Candidatus Bathyarchaeia archaeon]
MNLKKNDAAHYREIQHVLWVVLALNWLVALAKIVLGLFSRSASMTADGLHSFSDGASNIVGLVGIAFASQPKDEDHPYGHKKFETFFSLGIAFFLGLVCFELAQKGIGRLYNPEIPDVTILSFAVMIGTILVNMTVMNYERRKGNELRSDILVSDAMHTKADILTSFSVIVSLVAVKLGFPILDAITTLIISLFIAHAAYEIIKESCRTLCDEVAIKDTSKIEEIVLSIAGVKTCHKIRSRGHRDAVNLDLHVHLDPGLTLEKTHFISHEIERLIKAGCPEISDVFVHVEPASRRAK